MSENASTTQDRGAAPGTPPPAASAAPPAPPEPGSFRLIATLGLAGFLSGVILVGVYALTQPTIEKNRRSALENAILKVLPGAVRFETLASKDGRLAVVRGPQQDGEAGGARIYAGFDADQRLVGFAIPGAEPGYQDQIHGILGYDPRQEAIVGFEVLESRETPGLGDKIQKDAAFRANFRRLAVDPAIEAVPPGKKSKPNQVETITGATISSKTVVRLLEKSVTAWRRPIAAWMASRSAEAARPTSARDGRAGPGRPAHEPAQKGAR